MEPFFSVEQEAENAMLKELVLLGDQVRSLLVDEIKLVDPQTPDPDVEIITEEIDVPIEFQAGNNRIKINKTMFSDFVNTEEGKTALRYLWVVGSIDYFVYNNPPGPDFSEPIYSPPDSLDPEYDAPTLRRNLVGSFLTFLTRANTENLQDLLAQIGKGEKRSVFFENLMKAGVRPVDVYMPLVFDFAPSILESEDPYVALLFGVNYLSALDKSLTKQKPEAFYEILDSFFEQRFRKYTEIERHETIDTRKILMSRDNEMVLRLLRSIQLYSKKLPQMSEDLKQNESDLNRLLDFLDTSFLEEDDEDFQL